ncbi:hypothetical protein O0Q50_20615 [Priestia aryabhattai]|uniref:Uncharacterized protein n=1 Tax=Priestia aryabhattai TaxID=412384 RepID=A0AAX6NCE0_PRIAR|nr:hypothetical protein [Priestia aryabhattai]MDU9693583.1 hypothetical protein [Priestia aryabhattai]
MKSLQNLSFKENSKEIIVSTILIFFLAFCVSLLFPDVRHHIVFWFNNLTYKFDGAIGQPALSNKDSESLGLKNETW